MKKKYIIMGLAVVAGVFIVMSVLMASLNSARSKGMMGVSSSAPSLNMMYDNDSYSYKNSGRSYESQNAGGSDTVVLDTRKIIKTGSLALVVADVESVASAIATIAVEQGGYVTHRDISDSQAQKKSGVMTVRVPNDAFEKTVSAIKEKADRVSRESLSTQDVSEEYADVQAQLKNKKSVEEQYLQTLGRATTIEDILQVQQRLDIVRGEIERMEGRIQYLDRQVDMSTITISLVSEAEVAVFGVVWEPLTKIKQASYDALEGLITFVYFIIRLIFVVPMIVLWGGLFGGLGLVAWKIVRRIKRHVQEPMV